MSTGAYYLVGGILVLAVGYFSLRAFQVYLKLRGKRLVICPEARIPAAVELDAKGLAREAAWGTPHLRLSECSRWPERQGCGQECLRQIEAAPEGCLVRTIVTEWYEGKKCAYCGRVIHEVEWLGHKPALMDPVRKTVYWDHVPAEKLLEIFTTHAPVCWDCHIAETFRREHADLVTDRPARW